MKTLLLSLTCAALTTASVHAQVFQPQTARNILIGSVAGAIIGENNHHQALEGAAIGAAAGYIWSAATQAPAREYAPPVPVTTTCEPRVVYTEPACPPPVCVERPVVVVRPRVVVVAPPPAPVVIYREAPRYHHRERVVYVAPADGHGHREYYYGRPVRRW
ncbi:hypothetical protein DB347_08040 [Opitutaceae bacterium EW11]|nr:hypothetical protein DB347_08040 [Opitutaceae bacterium EW11]